MPRGIPNTRAIDNPVTTGKDVIGPGDVAQPQRAPIDLGQRLADGGSPPIETDVETLAQQVKAKATEDYLRELKFNEDPVTIVITPSSDRHAPKHVFCGVNGVGAEVYDKQNNRWLRFEWLPVSKVLTVKRKYLEVLAKSKRENFTTREVTPTPQPNQDGFVLEAETVPTAPFVVRQDPAGDAGVQWYQKVMSEF
jgi:hypothetical protein